VPDARGLGFAPTAYLLLGSRHVYGTLTRGRARRHGEEVTACSGDLVRAVGAAKTQERVLTWTPSRRDLRQDNGCPMLEFEVQMGGMTVTLDRFQADDGEEYTGYRVTWELMGDLFPADGYVFRDPEGEAVFEELWPQASHGLDWDQIPVEPAPPEDDEP